MNILKAISMAVLMLMVLSLHKCFAQAKKLPEVCKPDAFAAFKHLPAINYQCPEGLTESDDKILALPQRLEALKNVMKQLESFADDAWWKTNVDDLNVCEIHRQAGELSDDEKQKFKDGDYEFLLLGSHKIRLVLTPDPCYQPGFGGANAFLLYSKGPQVFVTQVLNGYYSRADNSVSVSFALLNGQQIVEISTGNSMPPSLVNYYFVIDGATNKAVPKNLFNQRGKLTNQITSALLLSEPANLGLPQSAAELNLIRGNRLASSFSAYEEDDHGRINSNGRRMRRVVYRWNGKAYLRTK